MKSILALHRNTLLSKQKLLGSDTDGVDAFGLSVFIDETYELLAIGAPYAEDNGVPEVRYDEVDEMNVVLPHNQPRTK